MPLLADNLRSLYASMTVLALTVAALVLGRVILIPFAVATIIAFILGPVVRKLARWRVPESLAVAAVLGGVLSIVVSLSVVFSAQMLELAASFGTYRANIIEKARSVSVMGREGGLLQRASEAVETLGTALEQELSPAARGSGSVATPETQVVVAQKTGVLDHVATLAEPLAQMALTLLFTVFLLLQHQDLRDRVVRIAGTDNLSGTTAAMSDAGTRLSRLFFALAMLNVSFGVFIGFALWLIGVPNPLLWGAVTAVMRFVPFIGSFVAAVPPILLAAAVDPGWGMAIATLMLFLIGEPLMGHVVEPLVLGRQVGLSPLAMIVAASFWTLVWGPVGLLLAAPLTMLLVVLGRYIPALEVFSVLLGDEPALSPDQEFYGRVLAADCESAVTQVSEAVDEGSVSAASDDIVLPALRLAAIDHRRGRLDAPRLRELRETMSVVSDAVAVAAETASGDGLPIKGERAPSLLVLPARGPVDGLAAEYMATTLDAVGRWRVEGSGSAAGLTAIANRAADTDAPPADAVLIVTVGGVDPRHLELIVRRARRDFPNARIMTYEGSGVPAAGVRRTGASATGVPASGGREAEEHVTRYTQFAEIAAAIEFTPSEPASARKSPLRPVEPAAE